MAGPQNSDQQNPGQGMNPDAQQQEGNGMAVAAMVLGILGLVLSFVAGAGFICGLLGLIFGIIGIKKAGRIGGKGKGMALTGLITGSIGMLINLIIIAVVVFVLIAAGEDASNSPLYK